MFKIKMDKAKRRAELLEKRDERGDKFNKAVKQIALFPSFVSLKLTEEQAAVVIARWWRR